MVGWKGLTLAILFEVWLTKLVHASTTSSSDGSVLSRLSGTKPDPFVQRAPLVVAMACRDGVAIVAAHPGPQEEECLLYAESENDGTSDVLRDNPNGSDQAKTAPFLDLPLSYEGPLRIHSIGTLGTALVSCGWGADGSGRMVDKARELCTIERQSFGTESQAILPMQLSLFMAECAVSGSKRSLSCASLVAFGKDERNNGQSALVSASSRVGCLWLVDETGSYPVRAQCLGGGLVTQTSGRRGDTRESVAVATVVNRRLLELWRKQPTENLRLPYFDVAVDEGLEILLQILSTESNDKARLDPLLPPKTRLELASVDAIQQRVHRRRVRDVWKNTPHVTGHV